MAAGGDEIGQVPRHMPEAVAVLPEAAPESPAPGGIAVESLHMLVVEPVEPLPGGDAAGNEDEVQAVHLPPLLLKAPLFPDRLPDRGAGEAISLEWLEPSHLRFFRQMRGYDLKQTLIFFHLRGINIRP